MVAHDNAHAERPSVPNEGEIMRNLTRVPALVVGAVSVAMLAACANPTMPGYSSYPSGPSVATYQTAGVEYGRISNIEYLPVGSTAPSHNILGAVVGGLAGAALGSTIGGGAGRAAATVLGGVAGAAIGNQVARNQAGATMAPGYRITMTTDNGGLRTYEVPATGDLHVGDRVRIDNGVIYRA
jgi:outer membrane lipoprotein SlyB